MLESFEAPPNANIVEVRGYDNLYSMEEIIQKHVSEAPANAPVVKELTLHKTLNHSSVEKLLWVQRE